MLLNYLEKIYNDIEIQVGDKLNDKKRMYVNRGVLQGSVLSPFLFNIYIDDLIELLNKNQICYAYADDFVIICRTEQQLLEAMEIIDKWCKLNEMKVNKRKSAIMKLRKKQSKDMKDINGYP